jgi:hypothetical protein
MSELQTQIDILHRSPGAKDALATFDLHDGSFFSLADGKMPFHYMLCSSSRETYFPSSSK